MTHIDNTTVSSPLSTPTPDSDTAANSTCIDNYGNTPPTPSLELTPQKTINAHNNIGNSFNRLLCEDCKPDLNKYNCKCTNNNEIDTTTRCAHCNRCLCERIYDAEKNNEMSKTLPDHYQERPLPTY